MTIALIDIVHARLDAIAYERTAEAIRQHDANSRAQKLHNLCAEIAYANGFEIGDLVAPGRTQPLSRVRQSFMDRAALAGYSLTEIGDFLGGRDHTTILHGIRQARKRRQA